MGWLPPSSVNPINVAVEASPLPTVIEIKAGKELCDLVGFLTDIKSDPIDWGHITCDGSIANLESMWAARNLKFYPFSVKKAVKKELAFIADTFKVPLCSEDDGAATKLLKDFTTWKLLNITPSNVLNIPTRLLTEYAVTLTFLQKTIKPCLIQTLEKASIEEEFDSKPMAYFASATMHYSWPKAAAVTGIGSENVLAVDVDNSARMDVNDLEKHLEECLKNNRAVYAVVAIIGSTEHGACDPLKHIVTVREKYRKKGVSFVLHADGAWGTYFMTTISPEHRTVIRPPQRKILAGKPKDNYVPTLPLKFETAQSLGYLSDCGSITVDPHKSGYTQYPAGGLLYRDQRMRCLVTWTSPIVYRNEPENIGVYSIEGSNLVLSLCDRPWVERICSAFGRLYLVRLRCMPSSPRFRSLLRKWALSTPSQSTSASTAHSHQY
ncbi:hypothetical protein FRB93_002569 [Tulasnella sp. JGI-2019a]|nr:hypothetical protein FRB93_002569 [Tulasnella sp. JGI-2019a]